MTGRMGLARRGARSFRGLLARAAAAIAARALLLACVAAAFASPRDPSRGCPGSGGV